MYFTYLFMFILFIYIYVNFLFIFFLIYERCLCKKHINHFDQLLSK